MAETLAEKFAVGNTLTLKMRSTPIVCVDQRIKDIPLVKKRIRIKDSFRIKTGWMVIDTNGDQWLYPC